MDAPSAKSLSICKCMCISFWSTVSTRQPLKLELGILVCIGLCHIPRWYISFERSLGSLVNVPQVCVHFASVGFLFHTCRIGKKSSFAEELLAALSYIRTHHFAFFFISLLVTWKVVRQTGGMSKPIARQPPDTLFNSFLLYEFFYKLQNFTVFRLQVKNENWVTGMRELPVSHFFVGRAATKCVMDYATHCEHVSRFVKRFV